MKMKRVLSRFVLPAVFGLVLACCAGAPGASAAEAGNLLYNGDFEILNARGNPEGWTLARWSRDGSRGSMSVVEEAVSGERAVRIAGLENAPAREPGGSEQSPNMIFFSKPVEAEPGRYLLSGWYRKDGDVQANMRAFFYAGGFEEQRWSAPRAQDAGMWRLRPAEQWTKETVEIAGVKWTKFEIDVNAGQDVRQIVVVLHLSGLGEVFYDDVSLVRR